MFSSSCSHHKRVFRILQTLPFFQALCGRGDMAGMVFFDPTAEATPLLLLWLEYRAPGSRAWSTTLPRRELDREVVRDMLLHGTSPGLGGFSGWDPQLPSTAFLERYLAWYGIVPSAPEDARHPPPPEAWWRATAARQLTYTAKGVEKLVLLSSDEAPLGLSALVRAAATTRAFRGRLMESFELADDHTLARLDKASFDTVLRTLAGVQFPPSAVDDVLSSETHEERLKGETAWQVGRMLRALRERTGIAARELRQYVEVTYDGVKVTQARMAEDPRSNSIANSEFYARHGLTVALKAAAATKHVGAFLATNASKTAVTSVLRKATGWEANARVSEDLVRLGLAVARTDAQGSLLAFAHLLVHVRRSVLKKTKYEAVGLSDILGETAAKVFGVDSGTQIDELLVRAMIPAMLAKT